MSFTPVIPLTGYAGWTFLQRTLDTQKAAFDNSAAQQRDEDYFTAKIGSIRSAEELVSDYRLLKVSLGAFGLDDDLSNKFYIRKVLEEGSLDSSSLANKLTDKRYLELTKAFGFGDFTTPRTVLSDFPEEILSAYRERQFEAAVGDQNTDMRLALNAQRELGTLAASSSSDDTKWFKILGSESLRSVFQTAFGLPTSFASIDLDQQLTVMKAKAKSLFGSSSISDFANSDKVDALIKRFLIMSDLTGSSSSATTKGSSALTLLQSSGSAANILSILH
ncbi:DUF1217 domain-containing protein [Falsirhodobacter sp. alg1]|uniref:DUF1217 domain-containing protein n=1 Tax=Falsirhodobacter sp. alg1 TaxID=1472418 RepID=UPI0005EFEB51|nr:DUF1217 domain-containing protein [Falsirhodobacter sp. alg1]